MLDVGDAVSSFAPGQLVSVPFQISCGECDAVPAGAHVELHGRAVHVHLRLRPGGRAVGRLPLDVVCVPYAEHMLVPVPAGLEPAAVASASDNISDAWRAVGPALAERPGADVLVVGGAGAGSIGLYAAGLAVALGSESVLYVDADESRREIAATLGAQTLARDARSALGPFPITVDASADPDGLALALRSTAPDGICTSTAIYFGEQPRCRCSRCTRRASPSRPAAPTRARRCHTCSSWPPPARCDPSWSRRGGRLG